MLGLGGEPGLLDHVGSKQTSVDTLLGNNRKKRVARLEQPRTDVGERLLLVHDLVVSDHRLAHGNRREHSGRPTADEAESARLEIALREWPGPQPATSHRLGE